MVTRISSKILKNARTFFITVMFCRRIWYELAMQIKRCSIREHAKEVENRYARCPMERIYEKSRFFLLMSALRAQGGQCGQIEEILSYQEHGNEEQGTWHIAIFFIHGLKYLHPKESNILCWLQNSKESRPGKIRHVTQKICRRHIDLKYRRNFIHQCLIDAPTPSRESKTIHSGSIHLAR